MSRKLTVGAAQMGPIARSESRRSVVRRMIALLDDAKARGCDYVVFPELALTTFFPRWWFEDRAEILPFFETEMPGSETRPLFDRARDHGLAFTFGYAERTPQGELFNTSIIVDKAGEIIGKYRKVHLPGHKDHEPDRPFQHLEKGYFVPGDLGFPVFDGLGGRLGMLICNDRRWPEAWRVLALRGAELVTLGYNTPWHYPPMPGNDHLQNFHNHLVMQAGAYQNGLWVVGVAKAGVEEDCLLIGQSCIIAPTGEIVAMCSSIGDELVTATIDLERCQEFRRTIFDFALHRQPHHYGPITGGA